MTYSSIRKVWDLFNVQREEIEGVKNAQEAIQQYSDNQTAIPVRIVELNDPKMRSCIVLAGEAALYPWEVGQRVELSFIGSLIDKLHYLREMNLKGIDNSPYQNFILYDTITPIERGEYYPGKNAMTYSGLYSYEIFIELANIVLGIRDKDGQDTNEDDDLFNKTW